MPHFYFQPDASPPRRRSARLGECLRLGEPEAIFFINVPSPQRRVDPPRCSTGLPRQTNLLNKLCFLIFVKPFCFLFL